MCNAAKSAARKGRKGAQIQRAGRWVLICCLIGLSFCLTTPCKNAFVGARSQFLHQQFPHQLCLGLRLAATSDGEDIAALLERAETLRREAEALEKGNLEPKSDLDAAKEELAAAKALLAKVKAEKAERPCSSTSSDGANAAGEDVNCSKCGGNSGSCGDNTNSGPIRGGGWEKVNVNYGGKLMSEKEWRELADKFRDMNLLEQFSTNQKLGPQGRRKLAAMREGTANGSSFVLPGELVRLHQDEKAFKEGFKRFRDPVNGYNDEKAKRRGEECIVEAVFNDKTFTAVFIDSARFDFPMEVVDGYSD
eukprot:TRINITY_DN57593_c0_g1_i1.p1 TRINITY_DN57593_c0_g1~~TRINITY_DN57593_c0_g1_i1.p1  ORF type:complete len:307 (+),score=74.03 TRINITY_DN57593_c0_g1_i1:19-939(+)